MAPSVPLDQVVWRIDSSAWESDGGYVARYVPYVNAPIVARLLDEWVGPLDWWDRYERASKGLICHLTIRDADTGTETTKVDVGVAPSGDDNMSVKGEVSDAFKRAACLKWGVARNVYELPTLIGPVVVRGNDLKKPRPARDAQERLVAQLRRLGHTDAADALKLDSDDQATSESTPGAGTSQSRAVSGNDEVSHALDAVSNSSGILTWDALQSLVEAKAIGKAAAVKAARGVLDLPDTELPRRFDDLENLTGEQWVALTDVIRQSL